MSITSSQSPTTIWPHDWQFTWTLCDRCLQSITNGNQQKPKMVWVSLKHLLPTGKTHTLVDFKLNVFATSLALDSWVIVASKSLFQESQSFFVATNRKRKAKTNAVSAFHSVFRKQCDVKTFGCDKQQEDWCAAPGEPQIAAGRPLCALWIAVPRHRHSVLPHDKQLLNLN